METPDYSNFRILVDTPSDKPELGFEQTARGLASIIRLSEPQFAIGVFGSWGSGKTTLMNAIKAELTQQKIITVDFSAWRYEKEEHLIIPLLDTIRDALVDWSEHLLKHEAKLSEGVKKRRTEFSEAAIKTAKTIGKVMASLTAGLSFKLGLPGALELAYDANKALSHAEKWDEKDKPSGPNGSFAQKRSNPHLSQSFYHACFKSLKESFDEFKKSAGSTRIVIFVDDLDRCLPAGAVQVLESIKLFFDMKGFVFVVGLDRAVVERCIDLSYAAASPKQPGAAGEDLPGQQIIKGADYLKKIFQVPFSLAPIAIGQIDGLFKSLCKDSKLPQAQKDDLQKVVKPHLSFLETGMSINPREVKRYINAYTIQMKVKPNLDPNAVLALQTISFRQDWARLDEALNTYAMEFTDALQAYFSGNRKAIEEFDMQLADITKELEGYLGSGGPGNPLLKVENLDEYLYSGEAIRSEFGGQYINILRAFRALQSSFEGVIEAKSETDVDTAWSATGDPFYKLRDSLSRVSTSTAGLALNQNIQDLESWLFNSDNRVKNDLKGAHRPGLVDKDLDKSREEARVRIRRQLDGFREALRQFRRQSNLSG